VAKSILKSDMLLATDRLVAKKYTESLKFDILFSHRPARG
jgi:hypothetical protein